MYKNKRFGVFGLGLSGLATMKYLASHKAEFIAADDQLNAILNISSNYPELAANLKELTDDSWQKIDYLILSPGIALTHPNPHPVVELARKVNAKIICDIELLYLDNPNAFFIGITGTNGKSTTTALITHILKHNGVNAILGGNIGVPVLDLKAIDKNTVFVIEASSFQLDLLDKTKFNIALLLNISPDHLDRHGNMENYTKSKYRIFKHQNRSMLSSLPAALAEGEDPEKNFQLDPRSSLRSSKDDGIGLKCSSKDNNSEMKYLSKDDGNFFAVQDTAIINLDFAPVTNSITFSENKKSDVTIIDNILYYADKSYILPDNNSLLGKHNQQNLAASIACCIKYGLSIEQIIAAIPSFVGLKHRMQYLGEHKQVTFINDSKATNADSSAKALASFDNIIWIAGGVAKEGGIASLKEYFPKIKQALLIGKSQAEFAQTCGEMVAWQKCDNLTTAFKIACETSIPGDVVLLSPACASYDQWKNFEERGDFFIKMVENLKN